MLFNTILFFILFLCSLIRTRALHYLGLFPTIYYSVFFYRFFFFLRHATARATAFLQVKYYKLDFVGERIYCVNIGSFSCSTKIYRLAR